MSKSFILLSQVFLTFMVAASVSGIMSLAQAGATTEWLTSWPREFIIVWPIGFCLTVVAWPAATTLAGAVLGTKADQRD